MTENASFDLVVIGGGPAGYVGAIRAAQLGMKVACVERDRLGGVCNNWGCIPTKALLAGAEFYHRLKHEAGDWGILADNIRHDWGKVIARSRGVADLGDKGVTALFKKNKITHVQGTAFIPRPGAVEVRGGDGKTTQTLTCKNILVCTGARPRQLPGAVPGAGAAFNGKTIISYKDAMVLPEQPGRIVIIGAGPIGMEFAYFFNAYGTKTTVVEMMPNVLPNEDEDSSKAVAKAFRKIGIESLTGMKVLSVEQGGPAMKATVAPADNEKEQRSLEADVVLVAIGVVGRFDGLFADALKVETDRGHIKVDKKTYQTSVKGVYAAGDVIGPPWLAHVASEEAIVCVETIAGHHPQPIDYAAIPGCTYCQPQVASLGVTEQKLKSEGKKIGVDYKVGKFPFLASGKARALGNTEGFVKIISDAKHGEILGVHMVGESVTELLAEMGLAKRLEATVDEVIATMHAHPTLSEALHEAALSAQGRAIHA